jgi:hypothetical protein
MGRKKGKGWISYLQEEIPELNIRRAQRAMKVAKMVDPDKHPELTILSQRKLSSLVLAIGKKSLDEELAGHNITNDFPLNDQTAARDFEKGIEKLIKELRKEADSKIPNFVRDFSRSVDRLQRSFEELSEDREFLKPLSELNLKDVESKLSTILHKIREARELMQASE